MPVDQLTYTPLKEAADQHPCTFVLMVDDEMFEKYRKGDKSVPLVEIVSSFDVAKFHSPGNEGKLVQPTNSEKEAAFGTTNATEIVQFMLGKGTLRVKHHGKAKKVKEPKSSMETLMNADRRVY